MSMPRHVPTNQGELELYQVLQRANVLQYYDIFISQGGDDVRQLCESGEEEFLEIMALVGMAQKPLHVRRLQKALQEWLRAPGALQQHAPGPPLGTIGTSAVPPNALKAMMGHHIGHMNAHMIPNQIHNQSRSQLSPCHNSPPQRIPQMPNLRPARGQQMTNGHSMPGTRKSPQMDSSSPLMNGHMGLVNGTRSPSIISVNQMTVVPGTGQYVPKIELNSSASPTHSPHSNRGSSPEASTGCTSPGPMSALSLTDTQIKSIKEASAGLVNNLPPFDPKPPNVKKTISQDIQNLLNLPIDDKSRMNGIRKYSAIYGRFDSKRKYDKPMTLHEISVNEAAAQLCHLVPELLTRRDELFPLARQVVKDSGNLYLKGNPSFGDLEMNFSKRMKTESLLLTGDHTNSTEFDLMQREILSDIVRDLNFLDQENEHLRSRVHSAKSNQDSALQHSLQQEMSALAVRRQQLVAQQNVLMTTGKDQYQYTKPTTDDSDTSHSLVSSPRGSSNGEDYDRELDLSVNSNKKSSPVLLEKTLVDEGLRLAQTYSISTIHKSVRNGENEDTENHTHVNRSSNGVNASVNGDNDVNSAKKTFMDVEMGIKHEMTCSKPAINTAVN